MAQQKLNLKISGNKGLTEIKAHMLVGGFLSHQVNPIKNHQVVLKQMQLPCTVWTITSHVVIYITHIISLLCSVQYFMSAVTLIENLKYIVITVIYCSVSTVLEEYQQA